MNYLLDSNTVSDLYNRSSPLHEPIRRHLATLTDEDNVYISILTLYEMEYGCANAPDDKQIAIRRQIQLLQEDFRLLPLHPKAAFIFGTLKKNIQEDRQLSAKSIKQHNIDIMIAANAILLNCKIVSEDKLFTALAKQDSRLHVENWSKMSTL